MASDERAWLRVSETSDAEDPHARVLLVSSERRQRCSWAQLGVKAGAVLACLALGGTLVFAPSRGAWAGSHAGATTGLSLLGQGYTRLPDTECWMRTRIGEALLDIGPKACQSSCDFREECMAFEMYDGNRHCMLLSNCSGWASGTTGAYVMVKEPGYFGIGRPMLKLPDGMEDGRTPQPRQRRTTTAPPRWKLPSWSTDSGKEEVRDGKDILGSQPQQPQLVQPQRPQGPQRPGLNLPGGFSLPQLPVFPSLARLVPGGGQEDSRGSSSGREGLRPEDMAPKRPQGDSAAFEERHKQLQEKPWQHREGAAPDQAAPGPAPPPQDNAAPSTQHATAAPGPAPPPRDSAAPSAQQPTAEPSPAPPPRDSAAPSEQEPTVASHPLTHKVAFTADMYGQVSTGTQQSDESQQAKLGQKEGQEVSAGTQQSAESQQAKPERTDVEEAPRPQAHNKSRIVSFYVYRAQSSDDYPAENVNVADLPGVLWYLQEEVITQCPRKFDISRVIRLKFSAKLGRPTSFIPYVAFDSGKCTVPGCDNVWQRYGYHVGCQRTGAGGCYGKEPGHWFSLPGPCPGNAAGAKGRTCRKAVPGGACSSLEELREPGGTCSYHVEQDGEILLNKLVGISNYTAFCEEGKAEYDEATDRGRGFHFWDGKRDRWKAAWRLEVVKSYLKLAYPHKPLTFGEDEPHCGYPSLGHKCL